MKTQDRLEATADESMDVTIANMTKGLLKPDGTQYERNF